MSDVKNLLDEAVGSYEPRADQRAVEQFVERRRQRRRLASGSVAIAVFVVAGWFAWTAFRPSGSTVGSTGSGTYILSDFGVSPYVDRGTDEIDPAQAKVTFAMHWSSNEYPGDHSCTLRVFDPAGAQIGSVSVQMASLMQANSSSMPLPVTGSIDGADATGSCAPERLDAPVAYDISDVHITNDLTVSYIAGWPDSLGESEYPGTNACTVALFQDGEIVAQKYLTLAVGDHQEVTSTQFNEFNDQAVLIPPASLDATVACEPYVREGVYPGPRPLTGATMPPEIDTVFVPEVIGLSLEQAVAELERLGFKAAIAVTASEDIAEGFVASQEPAPGTSIDPGATVTIVVSEGPGGAGSEGVEGVWCKVGRGCFEASDGFQSADIPYELPGPEHCGWQSETFLSFEDGSYVRDEDNDLTNELDVTYDADASLPPDAQYTGWHSGERQLWVSDSDLDEPGWPYANVYVVTRDGVQRWPRFDAGCV